MIKEPLFVFLLLGGGIFFLFQQVSGETQSDEFEIVVTPERIQALSWRYKKVWSRLPNEKEMEALIQSYIREEVLYREALAMGLDQNDGIIRRRLQQKMEFISEDLSDLNKPKDQDLQAYMETHQGDYRQPSRFSFRHIYFNSSVRGKSAEADAKALLNRLRTGNVDVTQYGDSIMLQKSFSLTTERDIARAFGARFLQGLFKLPTGKWQGPILSGFGLHLVFIEEYVEGEPAKLGDVRAQLVRDWRAAKRKEANAAFYQELRSRYKVTVADAMGGNVASLSTSN